MIGFPTGRDSVTFRDKGTKGQRDKLKVLPRDGTGQDSQNSGRAGIAKNRDTGQNRTEQKRMF